VVSCSHSQRPCSGRGNKPGFCVEYGSLCWDVGSCNGCRTAVLNGARCGRAFDRAFWPLAFEERSSQGSSFGLPRASDCLYRVIEHNSARDVRISGRVLAKAAGSAERSVDAERKTLAAKVSSACRSSILTAPPHFNTLCPVLCFRARSGSSEDNGCGGQRSGRIQIGISFGVGRSASQRFASVALTLW
jgi:hypothetical protein